MKYVETVEIGNLSIPAVKGEKGDTGSQGIAGKIVSLDVIMLESTEDAYIKNNGTENEAEIELGIPKGDGVDSVTINENSELIITLTSGIKFNLGIVKGTGISNVAIQDGSLIVTLTDGTQINAGEIELNTEDLKWIAEKINLVNAMGDYSEETTYSAYDVVTYNGSSYLAIQECTGIVPTNTEYWQLLAEKGEEGATPVLGVDYYTDEQIAELVSQITDDANSAFNSNVAEQTEAFNTNAETKTEEFNTNADTLTTTFNTNATEKTETFNTNVETKTTEFNSNATTQTETFDSNAETKTTEFNTNASTQTETFNTNAEEKIEEINNIIAESSIPLGVCLPYFGTEEQDGFKFPNGQELSRTDYSELFEIIGTTYGEGDGETTFNLPDMRERVPVMYSEGSDTMNELGKTGGSETTTLTTNNLPSHTHSISITTSSSGSHTHTIVINTCQSSNEASGYGLLESQAFIDRPMVYSSGNGSITSKSAGSHTHTVSGTSGSTGSGEAFSNLQPYIVCNYLMKVK